MLSIIQLLLILVTVHVWNRLELSFPSRYAANFADKNCRGQVSDYRERTVPRIRDRRCLGSLDRSHQSSSLCSERSCSLRDGGGGREKDREGGRERERRRQIEEGIYCVRDASIRCGFLRSAGRGTERGRADCAFAEPSHIQRGRRGRRTAVGKA